MLGHVAQLPELLGQQRRLGFPATYSHTGGGRKSLKTGVSWALHQHGKRRKTAEYIFRAENIMAHGISADYREN